MRSLWNIASVLALLTSLGLTQASISARHQSNTTDEFSIYQSQELIYYQSQEDKFYPIKEIIDVNIVDAAEGSPLRKLLNRKRTKLYVEFHHRGKVRGKSLPLRDSPSGVNLPILATEKAMRKPIMCKIKRSRRFLRDKTVFTADMDLRDEDEGEVTSIVRDLKGKDTGARIKLSLFFTEYVPGTFDGVNPPKKVDLYFRLALGRLDRLATLFFPGGAENLKKPFELARPDLKTYKLLDGLLEYPKKDEFFKPDWEIKYGPPIANRVLRMTNRNNPLKDRATSRNEIRTEMVYDYLAQPAEGRWRAPLSDRSMQRVFFSSLGMFKTRKVNNATDEYSSGNEYVSDWTYLSELTYKKRFENLGLKVYFDDKAQIALIEDNDGSVYRPRDELWEWAKLKARSAAFTLTSLIHVVDYHLIWGNNPAMALRKYLPPSHPVRIALTPHFFRTHQTCLQARDLLIAKRGPLHRVLSFEYEGGLEKVYRDLFINFKFKTWPEELEEMGMQDDEFHVGATDGLGLHKVMMSYVSNLFDEIYPNDESLEADDDIQRMYAYLAKRMRGPAEFSMDNLKTVWGEVLFRVTGMHQSIGNAAAYVLEPFMVNFRLDKTDKGKVYGNRETLKIGAFITGLTIPDVYPKLTSNWTEVMHDPESKSYTQLKDDLSVLTQEIEERNKVRTFKNVDFLPDNAALSIFG